MSGRQWASLLVQLGLIVGATVAASSIDPLQARIVFIEYLGASMVCLLAVLAIPQTRARLPQWAAEQSYTWLIWLGLTVATSILDPSLVLAAVLIPAFLAAASGRLTSFKRTPWKLLAILWLGFLASLWAVMGYLANLRDGFFAALLCLLGLLILCRLSFRMNTLVAQTVNTLILLLVGLPVADLVYSIPRFAELSPETVANYYSYDKSRGDPNALARATLFQRGFFDSASVVLFEDIPHHTQSSGRSAPSRGVLQRPGVQEAGYRLRPGSHAVVMRCPISINSNGFRGKEIPGDKGNAYRIVALGESTTFGITFQATDRPWPEVLEQLIRERLKTRRPVEVINAGTPSYTIWDNINRMANQILPLKPDMIISYHGYNGFYMINSSIAHPVGPVAPSYENRPLKLAADFEYRIKMLRYFNRYKPKAPPGQQFFTDPMKSDYAKAYRELIQMAATNRIHLMLATYSMAASENSPPGVVAFYQGGGADTILWLIQANLAETQIIRQLTKEHPEVGLIDTQPYLDGQHEQFIDIVHFTQAGRQQMAEIMFAGIKETLEKEIGQ
jgi:lysophospholipase L1-like esterase